MAKIGDYNELEVLREVSIGLFLDGEELGDILIPGRYVPEGVQSGDRLRVFIYNDSEDRLIATTEKPRACVGEFAFMRVISVNAMGAFLDWGLSKDLLVPFREQKERMDVGSSYIVYLYLDDVSQRIVASSRMRRFLDQEPPTYQEGEEVPIIITHRTPLGYNAIIKNAHQGILYTNEVFQPLEQGQKTKAYVKKIREDNKIDLSLQPQGFGKVDSLTGKIMLALRTSGGKLSLSDKSPPEEIYAKFGCSKKAFKMAIGTLYKERKITIEPQKIRLV
jgi:predicted RNA-binding protein (virulence factor B family)